MKLVGLVGNKVTVSGAVVRCPKLSIVEEIHRTIKHGLGRRTIVNRQFPGSIAENCHVFTWNDDIVVARIPGPAIGTTVNDVPENIRRTGVHSLVANGSERKIEIIAPNPHVNGTTISLHGIIDGITNNVSINIQILLVPNSDNVVKAVGRSGQDNTATRRCRVGCMNVIVSYDVPFAIINSTGGKVDRARALGMSIPAGAFVPSSGAESRISNGIPLDDDSRQTSAVHNDAMIRGSPEIRFRDASDACGGGIIQAQPAWAHATRDVDLACPPIGNDVVLYDDIASRDHNGREFAVGDREIPQNDIRCTDGDACVRAGMVGVNGRGAAAIIDSPVCS